MTEFRELITKYDLAEAAAFLQAAQLDLPEGINFGLGYYEEGQLKATGFLSGNIICGICVSPELQGGGFSASIISRLIQQANTTGLHKLMLYTKPEEAVKFSSLGFSIVASAHNAALLEFGKPDCTDWLNATKLALKHAGHNTKLSAGAVVMNANPFTLGHRNLAEQALAQCDQVIVFVVEEDLSIFPFNVRFNLVQLGLADLSAAIVLPAGSYIVSRSSFPSYFTGKAARDEAHADLDCHIFGSRIAPELGITTRCVGAEPYDQVTAGYNHTLAQVLPQYGVALHEVPRLCAAGTPISASRVRALLGTPQTEETRQELEQLVPTSTLNFLYSPAAESIRQQLQGYTRRH